MPIPLTIAWLVTKMYEEEADSKYCGQGYTFLSSYWILEGPRIAAVMVRTDSHTMFLKGGWDGKKMQGKSEGPVRRPSARASK